MSVQSIQNNISTIQRDIDGLNRKLADVTKEEANKSSQIAGIKQSITRTTSQSLIQSKYRDIERLEKDIIRLQEKRADYTKKIGDQTAKYHQYQQQLFKEQTQEQNKAIEALKRQNEREKRRQEEVIQHLQHSIANTPFQHSMPLNMNLSMENEENTIIPSEYDVFISHASEDKDEFVRPLAEKLVAAGFKVWYDEFRLKVGDSLRRSIDKGLSRSRFGIVVLSPDFFRKNWPQYELDGLVAREVQGGKVILPIWHKVSKNEVLQYSPTLADKMALNTASLTIDELAKELAEVLHE